MPEPVARTAPSAGVRSAVGIFKLASDETRMSIALMLREGEMNVTEICAAVGQSQPAVSHHLALLRVSGLADPSRRGKHNFYSLTDKGQALLAAYDAIA